MCGIVGYVGNNAVKDVLLEGLQRLEYRGYDSSGMAFVGAHQTQVYRACGKLDNLRKILENAHTESSFQGIGHIRWATHGAATESNAHPHRSTDGKISLVHNGIIENYQALKEELQAQGFCFQSQTDTETAVYLIEREYQKYQSLEKAVIAAVQYLKGAFAFCIMHQDEPDKIIAVRKNAPLVIGLGKNGNMVASDIPALIGFVDRIVYLQDNEFAVLRQKDVSFYDFNGQSILKSPEPLALEAEQISKGHYAHYMLKEIHEQPDILRRLLSFYMPDGQNICLNGIDAKKMLRNIEQIEIVACGTSYNAGLAAKNVIEKLTDIPVRVEAASEYIYQKQLTNAQTLVLGISQSGETADTITALKQARLKNAQILVLTNREDSSIVQCADAILPLKAGIEVSVAATKSYTAQLVVLYLFAFKLAEVLGVANAETNYLKHALFELPVQMEQVLSAEKALEEVSALYASYSDFVFIGRGISYAGVLEGALKLKEISYINANAYMAGELKHGPIALIDENMPCVAILIKNSSTFDKIISNCEEIKARHGKLIGLVSDETYQNKLFDNLIRIPNVCEELSPLLTAPVLQLLAYHIALKLGREVDKPRNLAKSVTVE